MGAEAARLVEAHRGGQKPDSARSNVIEPPDLSSLTLDDRPSQNKVRQGLQQLSACFDHSTGFDADVLFMSAELQQRQGIDPSCTSECVYNADINCEAWQGSTAWKLDKATTHS